MAESYQDETIVAISTPPGRGGIGIVRLSGPQARGIAGPVLRLRQPLAHATARFAELVTTTADKLDDAVVTYFAAPHSYTGEDIVEIAAHGSPVVLEYLVRHALEHGARLARPGEFTERAFLGGRIDLTQAEAVRDLIEAQTLTQARTAAEQMGGALSRRIAPVKEALVALITTLEAGIDFAEDDIDVLPAPAIAARIADLKKSLQPIAASYAQGRVVHDGLRLAIVGRPNAGKSSLFNALIERDRAIVTALPGTTRDLVMETVSLGGIPVQLVDTAGLRETADEAEALGIAKTREAMAEADLVLVVIDATIAATNAGELALSAAERELLLSLRDRKPVIVLNKIDAVAAFSGQVDEQLVPVAVSALTGAGMEALRQHLLTLVRGANPDENTGLLTTVRHRDAVRQAQAALAAAYAAASISIPHEMLLLDLYSALDPLDSLTGTTTPEDILHRIFATFCIGK